MRFVIVALLLLCAGCPGQRRGPEGEPSPFRPAALKAVSDDMSAQSLRAAARASIAYYEGQGRRSGAVVLGDDHYDNEDLLRSARRVVELIEQTPGPALAARLAAECRAYSAGEPAKFTAYYEPVVAARRRPDRRFRYPIYRAPDGKQRARLIAKFGRLPTRAEIDRADGQNASRGSGTTGALRGFGLEVAWLDDPVARFFLHVQGSGRLSFDDGSSMRVGFASSNDAEYRSIGAVMLARGMLEKGKTSAPAMRAWLGAHSDKRDGVLFENPRYVFFRDVVGPGPIGALGVALVPGRSLATDPRFVPHGILTFVRTQVPVVDGDGRLVGHRPLTRFAFSHDAGAAIRGRARADIFWGSGEAAGTQAGYLSDSGEMLLLVCGGGRSGRGD